ncbi:MULTISPECIES: pyridoxamine 5'-phosphate oxidase family protein [Halorussus]|uniref:pyridoxamine 5'-phosphate oxidase family protein n=1 Tax=Halorussus TaxID=1070314 RepID=UPI000E20F883|nr:MULTISPECIES: pyridoxamine 5'-phosphate oxidase family protein [Halorussus]NHN59591.1 pyridoxamine 5'-phosphate oxidase family protein [Halorussus sp. JP-T4]
MEHVEYVYTFGMTDAELDDRLRAGEAGVLSLADGGDAYGVPVGYHFDGESLLVRLGDSEGSTKMEYLDATETATLVVYEKESDEESWSVVVRGTPRELPPKPDAEVNEEFEPFRLFDEDIEDVEAAIYELEMDEVTGRRTD